MSCAMETQQDDDHEVNPIRRCPYCGDVGVCRKTERLSPERILRHYKCRACQMYWRATIHYRILTVTLRLAMHKPPDPAKVEQRRRWVANGLCTRCGKPRAEGQRVCPKCSWLREHGERQDE